MSNRRFPVEEHEENISTAYKSDLSKEEAERLHNYFLDFKEATINNRNGTPQKALDALSHLEKYNSVSNTSDEWYKKPIGIVFLTVVAGLIINYVTYLFD